MLWRRVELCSHFISQVVNLSYIGTTNLENVQDKPRLSHLEYIPVFFVDRTSANPEMSLSEAQASQSLSTPG